MNMNFGKTIILFLFTQTLFFAQNLSLDEAINLALQNNEKILQYKSKLNSKEFENAAAWGNFLPSISLHGSYNHLDDELQIDLSPIRSAMIQLSASSQTELSNIYNILGGNSTYTDEQKLSIYNESISTLDAAIPSFVETLKSQDYNSAYFVATQPLFLGGKLIAAKKYSSAEEKAAKFELEKIENDVVAEVSKSYLQNRNCFNKKKCSKRDQAASTKCTEAF